MTDGRGAVPQEVTGTSPVMTGMGMTCGGGDVAGDGVPGNRD